MTVITPIWHWLQEVTGTNNGIPGHTSRWYNFVSGTGSDIGEITIIGVVYRLFKCHEPGCPRFGLHHHQNGKFRYCKKHHPEIN